MAYDRVLVANTRNWLLKAAKDLRRAEHALTPEWSDPEDSVFHCQQLAEKALKAFLTWHDIPFGKTHDLAGLCRQCADADTVFGGWAERLDKLTEYAWKFRYPGAPYEPTAEEAQRALALAREAYEAVLSRIPEEARP